MGIEAVINAERQRYVEFFVEAKTKLTGEQPDAVGELLISINNEALPYPYRYLRADIASKGKNGQPELGEVRIDIDPTFEARGYNFGAFKVEVYPFTWSSVQIVFDKAPQDLQQIEEWITRWLDVGDSGARAHQGLSGAIHSFSQMGSNGQWWFMTADFGTAPTHALIEFIQMLASLGMSHIVIKAG